MATPCNTLNTELVKISNLGRYSTLTHKDILYTIESGSSLYSRRSTMGDLMKYVSTNTGSFSGSFTGSLKGYISASGNFQNKPAFYGTSSYSVSASYVESKSYSETASFSTSSSYSENSDNSVSSSYSLSSSYSDRSSTSISASHALRSNTTISASHALKSDTATTASYALNVIGLGAYGTDNFLDNTSSDNIAIIEGYSPRAEYAFSHSFSSTPSITSVTLYCDSADANYSVGDEISINTLYSANGSTEFNPFVMWTNSTVVSTKIFTGLSIYAVDKSTNALSVLDKTKWKIRIRTWK